MSDGAPDLIRVDGVVNTDTGAPADGGSAFHIASMTEA